MHATVSTGTGTDPEICERMAISTKLLLSFHVHVLLIKTAIQECIINLTHAQTKEQGGLLATICWLDGFIN